MVCRAIYAVLFSAASVAGQGADLRERVAAALERSRPALARALAGTHGNALSLVCLAARHDGMGVDDRLFARVAARLARQRLSGTYAPSLRLMLAASYPELPRRDAVARRDLAAILSHQCPDGGFGYVANTSYWDLSNTQYAALGLRAAVAMRLPVSREVWTRLLAVVRAAQNDQGGFAYHRGEAPRAATLSMTVAGISVLEVCRQVLAPAGVEDAQIRAAIDRGWQWLARSAAQIGDRDVANCFYAHWGLERAAILSQRTHVGGVDWYARGAEMLLAAQKPDGGFRSRTDSHGVKAQTAFAVLFLRRAFRRDSPSWPLTDDR